MSKWITFDEEQEQRPKRRSKREKLAMFFAFYVGWKWFRRISR